MTTYRIDIEASNASQDIWQKTDEITITADAPPLAEAAEMIANLIHSDSDGAIDEDGDAGTWRVRIFEIDADGDDIGPWIVDCYEDGTIDYNYERIVWEAVTAAVEAEAERQAAVERADEAAMRRAQAVAHLVSVTNQVKAAALLGVSQPTVSALVAKAKEASS
jgi:predicted XRE-type DNA-binding protein